MTLFDWLQTNDGHSIVLAVVGLLQVVTLFIGAKLARDHHELTQKLNGHLEAHVDTAVQQVLAHDAAQGAQEHGSDQ